MKKIAQLGCGLVAGVLLAGCGSAGSGGGGVTPPAPNSTPVVSIDAMTTVPVINGSGTQGMLYVHNYGKTTANSLSFSLGSATTSSKLKSALAKVGLNLGGSLQDTQGFVLDASTCGSIPAGGSCAVKFTTPSLSVGNLGNSLVKLAYTAEKGAATTTQVVNYKYVNMAALSGVNFTGSLNVVGAQGTTPHVVGYVYGGGANGTIYKNVKLNSTNATTTISQGFIDGQEVAAGQVIAVEFAVGMQSNKASTVTVTPSWGGSSKLQSGLLNGSGGSALTLNLAPAQDTVNFIFGDLALLTAPQSTPAVVNVVNNGNGNSAGGLTAVATGGDAAGLTITNTNCASTLLLANAANSCQFNFTVTGYTSGTTTVEFKDSSNNVVASQTVYWTNDLPIAMLTIVPTPSTFTLGKAVTATESSVAFTITNIGHAPLTGVTYTPGNTGPGTWVQDGSTCTTTIAVAGSCAITGHLVGTNDGTGYVYYSVVGTQPNGNSGSFVGMPLSYSVTAQPSLEITPFSANMTVMANGVENKTQSYLVTNTGNDPALFSAINLLESSSNAYKPAIVSGAGAGTCTASTTLDQLQSCTVVVKYGPIPYTASINESGISTLQVDYHGGTPDTAYNSQSTLNYWLVGNDSYLEESAPLGTNLAGAGTVGSPFAGNANLTGMLITIKYTNVSLNYPMSNLNFNTNNLPRGLTVDGSSTCVTGSNVMTLESGISCNLVLALNPATLATIDGTVLLDFTSPTATWTTPLGFYSQTGSPIYVGYIQPTVAMTLSNNNGSFESTILSMTGANLDKGTDPVVSVSGVYGMLSESPVEPSANCTVESTTWGVSCGLAAGGTTSANVTYIMPTFLQPGIAESIPLVFSVPTPAYLNPKYTFINYVAP